MHLGRFHRAVELLHLEYKDFRPVDLIQEVESSLINVAANPGNTDIAKVYKTALDNCRNKLATSSFNSPRPILKDMLESINAQNFTGNTLFNRIYTAISSNPAAPSLAAQAIAKIREETQVFFHHIANVDDSFTKLKIEYDRLEEGEAEIGLLIPRNENASTLKDLGKEFNQWHNTLAPIAELFDPNAAPLQIKICATTDWMIYLAATPPVLWGVSKCIKGINSILRELIETKTLIEQLKGKNCSSKAIEALEQEQMDGAKTKLRELAEEMVDTHYSGVDDGRKHELKNAMTQSLHTIADKITDGTKLEVHMIAPAPPQGDDENNQNNEDAENLARLQSLATELDNDVDTLCFNGEGKAVKGFLVQLDNDTLGVNP